MTQLMTTHLPLTDFDPGDDSSYYQVEIDERGPVVHSECCSDRISVGTSRILYAALGRWLADQDQGNTPTQQKD